MQYNFKNPDGIFRGTDFWMLNDKLDTEELRRQIGCMHEQGVYSFIARTYIGLRSDYPGEEFMAKMAVILETAEQYGMKVFLQAGYMPEAIPGLREDCALHYIHPRKEEDVTDSDTVVCRHDGICYVDDNSVSFLDMFSREAVSHYLLESYERIWERFSRYYGSTVLSVWVDEPSYKLGQLPYTPGLAKTFRERWGYEIGDRFWMLFADGEESRTFRYHYWLVLEELLEHNYFEQIRDWCHAHNLWFSGHLMMEESMKFSILRACALMPYYKYFDMPGIDRLCAEMNWRHDEIHKIAPIAAPRYDMHNTPIQCTSAAHQAGKTHILCEMYGVSGQMMNFRDQRHMFDHFASLGINHRSVHGLFYSLHGRGKRAFPPHVHYYQPYFKKYRLVSDYVARTSAFITNGKPVKDTLLLHPQETAYTLYRARSASAADPLFQNPTPELDALDAAFYQTAFSLLRAQIPFDMGDEITLGDWGKVTADGLQVGEMTYKTVVVPYCSYLRASTKKLLDAYRAAGGTVLFLGCLPDHIDGWAAEPDPDWVLIPTVDALRSILTAMPRDLSFDCSGDSSSLQINRRSDGDTDYLMLFNSDCREGRTVTVRSDSPRRFRLFDARTGEDERLAGSAEACTVRIAEGSSVLLMLEKTDAAPEAADSKPRPVTSLTLDGSSSVRRDTPNTLLLEFCQYRYSESEPWSTKDYPVLAIHEKLIGMDYHGEIFLRFAFDSDIEGLPLQLAIEDPEYQKITFNGHPVNTDARGRWFRAVQFKVIDLPPALKKGRNLIEIRREFFPLKKAMNAVTSLFENLGGVELENLYLLGDFAVKSAREPSQNGTPRFSRSFRLTEENPTLSGMPELTAAGYPFYAGGMEITQTFTLPASMAAGRRIRLRADGFHGANAEITVNGKVCGDLCWYPYTLDITDAVRLGENTLTIRLVNTLRHLLGPYHRPCGEIGETWGDYQTPNKPWLGITPDNPDWMEHRETDTAAWTDSYYVPMLGIEQIIIESEA